MQTSPDASSDTSAEIPAGYRPLAPADLPAYLAGTPAAAVLGGTPDAWTAREIGDGNLNLVSIVTGPSGGLAVKQALPYLRLVGEGWPLPLRRAHFEHLALVEQARHAPRRVPAVVHYDATMALIAMELLHPHIILRHGLIRGIRYPHFAEHIADFIARTAFFTSDLALPAAAKKRMLEQLASNTALCKITEDLVFTEPYIEHENNRWTTPQLDKDVTALREDTSLHVAISELKERFLTCGQALIHGDLHTGSIMVTETDTRVIDPEFAFVGPIGFDVGAVLGNLLMSYYSQPGHARPDAPRDEHAEWVLEQVESVWTRFAEAFRSLWNAQHVGDAYPSALFGRDAAARAMAQDRYLRRLFEDSLGFAAAKMIRRIVGLAHNADFEQIEDPDARAACERRTLRLARHLMLARERIPDVRAVLDAARLA